MKIGAQLYTLHDYCKTLEDFSETLKRVADMGIPTFRCRAPVRMSPSGFATS